MKDVDNAYAGFWRRLKAWIVDLVLVMVTTCVVAIVVGFILAITIGLVIKDKDYANQIFSVIGNVIGLITYCSYFIGFEISKLQATPGKLLFGIKVTDIENQKIGFFRAASRLFGKFLSGFLLGLGFLICDFTAKKQALHDILANTLVVRANADNS